MQVAVQYNVTDSALRRVHSLVESSPTRIIYCVAKEWNVCLWLQARCPWCPCPLLSRTRYHLQRPDSYVSCFLISVLIPRSCQQLYGPASQKQLQRDAEDTITTTLAYIMVRLLHDSREDSCVCWNNRFITTCITSSCILYKGNLLPHSSDSNLLIILPLFLCSYSNSVCDNRVNTNADAALSFGSLWISKDQDDEDGLQCLHI